MKNYIKSMISVITALSCMAFPSISVNAATVDDCAAVARSYGVSESAIQSAYNAYYANPDAYTSEDFDLIIDTLHLYGTDSDRIIKGYFGITDNPDTPDNPDNSEPDIQPTEPDIQDTTQAVEDNNNSQSPETPQTPDDNISSSDFISMTIDQKSEYINSLPESERGSFIENLTTEERNSIIKQLPMDDKTEILSRFAEAGEQMGLNMTIDKITDDSVSMSIRNNDGTLVDQSSLGVIVEDTGYDYRMMFALVATGIIAASLGIYFIFRKILKDEKKHE